MTQNILKFSGILALLMLVVFAIHLSVLLFIDLPLFDNRIISAYIVNFVLAIIIYLAMLLLKHKYQSQLGFIFMFGSFLKFIVFFIVFYPFYKADNTITKMEFAAFFVPYVVCLIIETTSLSKWLNKLG
ncbi:DUF6168 family protein [Hanstruepera ponticola]|uniref:DUF6168 family protein n=1 Tax=Hanstruepera ponticola TaxID=2042995 RepID=UPI000CF120D9|nr:DUF6168 family protein [Hanstruepera ponticola]